jgi:hypothetical protein
MIGTNSCPYTRLCEQDLLGDLQGEDLARLEQHLDSGCGVCEETIELHLSGQGDELPGAAERRELESLVAGALGGVESGLEQGQAAVLDRVKAQIRREDVSNARRLRRRHLRAIFYVTNVAAVLMMCMAYVGLAAAVRLRARTAQILATETEIKALVTALSRYTREHQGVLPADMPGLVEALQTQRQGGQPYFRFDPARLSQGTYLDDFGRPYRFQPGSGRALIYSVGPDGKDDEGQSDDLSLWVLFAG